jgi:hypothetical protein
MKENLEKLNNCKGKINCKCIMTASLIIVLAISTSYLFIQYDKQNEMINNQMRYIEDLKSNITVDNAPFSVKSILVLSLKKICSHLKIYGLIAMIFL